MQDFLSPPNQKTTRKALLLDERCLYPIVSADILLAPHQREKVIADIKQAVNAAAEHFIILYQQLINNFAEFAQLLPATNDARMGSLMDEGLLRGLYALQTQKQLEVDEDDDQVDPLIAYLLFSAALLYDVGFANSNRTILISATDGSSIKEWVPTKEPMQTADGPYYRIRRGGGSPPWLSRRSAAIIARQIMPPVGFNWLAGDSFAFNSWIALLNDEKEEGELTAIFSRAKQMLREFKEQTDIYVPANIDIIEPEETALAEDFTEWLDESIEKNTIKINSPEAKIHVVEEGLFLEVPGIFKEFAAQSARPINWETVYDQFKKLGYIDQEEAEDKLAQYIYEDEHRAQYQTRDNSSLAFMRSYANINDNTTKNETSATQATIKTALAATSLTPKSQEIKTATKQLSKPQPAPGTKPESQKKPTWDFAEDIGKFGVRDGIIIHVPYFLLMWRGFNLPPEQDFRAVQMHAKDKKKRKKLHKRLLKYRKLKRFLHEIKELMLAELGRRLKDKEMLQFNRK